MEWVNLIEKRHTTFAPVNVQIPYSRPTFEDIIKGI